MKSRSSSYVATRTLAMPAWGVAYLATAQFGTGEFHRRHQHAEVQVLWVLAGSLGMEFQDGEVLSLEVGTACVIPPNVPHVVVPSPRIGEMVQLIDLRVIDDAANPFRQFLAALGGARRFVAPSKAVEVARHHLQTASDRGGLASQAGVLAAIWELLATLPRPGPERPADGGTATGDRDPRIGQAEDFCRHQLSSPLTVDHVAAAVGLSRSQLSRLFEATYGIGPAERLRLLRVELARHLLSATTLSIKEIARACGFVRANHFGRVFHQVTGMAPGAFRAGKELRIEDRG